MKNKKLINNIIKNNQNVGNVRETFFFNQLRVKHSITSSSKADFKIDTMDFEIGGKNKGKKQIESSENGFIVKDNIEIAYLRSEEHTSELQSRGQLVCRLLLEKKKTNETSFI